MPAFTITGVPEITRGLQEVEDFLDSPEWMQNICDAIKEKILLNTDRGLDYQGARFAEYAESTERARDRKGLQTEFVDLRETGRMLNSITAKAIDARHGIVTMGDSQSAEIAGYLNDGTTKMPMREFMNITDNGFNELVHQYYDDPLLVIVQRNRLSR